MVLKHRSDRTRAKCKWGKSLVARQVSKNFEAAEADLRLIGLHDLFMDDGFSAHVWCLGPIGLHDLFMDDGFSA